MGESSIMGCGGLLKMEGRIMLPGFKTFTLIPLLYVYQ